VNCRRKPVALLVVATALVLAVVGVRIAARRYRDGARIPIGVDRVVIIPDGASLTAAAAQIEEAGVIRDRRLLVALGRARKLDGRIRPGEYRFRGPATLDGLLDDLVAGRVVLHKVTIPEGLSLRQIARRVEEAGLGRADALIRAASDQGLLRRLGIPGATAEGFLFPDTYHFPRDIAAERVIEAMAGRFRQVWQDGLAAAAAARKESQLELVTIASIVEKETGVAAERPLVSAVIHNRLRAGIPLATDPVVIYGVAGFDGNLTRKHLETPGPYNVYLRKGLPPGPIASPGRASLDAAVNPAPVDFLYFVSKNNGTHQFSRTLREHNQAVNRYQKGRG
jgi:UPF0755 protein